MSPPALGDALHDNSRRQWVPALLVLIALGARALVAALTAVPGRDAAHYLWMAESFLAGDTAALFQTVFHPGYSVLVAAAATLLPVQIDTFRLAQVVGCGAGALAVWPLFVLTKRSFGHAPACWAGLLYALGTWFCRHPADALSEGPFYLCVALWAERTLACATACSSRQGVWIGALAGVAYTLRPEGAVLLQVAMAFLWQHRQARAMVCTCLSFSTVAAPLPIGWAIHGSGFTLTPKASFNYAVGVGQAEVGAVQHYVTELVKLPSAAFEDLGFLVLPLALIGLWRHRPRRWSDPTTVLAVPFLIQCLVIPMLRSHYRFLSGFGVLLLPLAAMTIVRLHLHWRSHRHRRWLLPLATTLLLGSELVRLPHPRRYDRLVLRELGTWLEQARQPGDRLATDMPRLSYFAGYRPPEPRPIAAAEILASARRPATRFVAVVRRRTPVSVESLQQLGFAPVTFTGDLAKLVARRGAAVWQRQR